MSFSIRVPDSAFHTQSINIGGRAFNITFKFNESDKSWYMRLSSLSEEDLTSDIKVMPNQNLTGRFPTESPLTEGNIWCLRFKNDYSPIGRYNLGVDKNYELVYLTFEEEEEIGISGTVQL
jgi:hypothetical protein